MKKLGLVLCLFLGGCASATTEYYEAVTAAAKANAVASQAKFDALSAIAAAGDGQAASAAVMALALTKTPTITPVPQQSQSIQWASILAAPITSLGMAWVQSDASKSIAKYNADVSLARVQATAQGNAALYGAFADMNQGAVDLGVAGLEAAGSTPDYSDFIDGMVTLGTAGITGAVDLGTAGFGANVDIATAGMTGLVDLGTAGITGVVDMGSAGITGVTSVSLDGFDTLLNLDTGNNSLLEGVWENYTTSIEQIVSDIPRVCQATTNEDGQLVLVCN
jgi:hypothetical protein